MFSEKDYLALFKLSLRSFFWCVDKRAGIKRLFKMDELISLTIGLFMLAGMIMFLTIPLTILRVFILLITFRFVDMVITLVYILQQVAVGLIFFNPTRLRYSVMYKKSDWFKNTGILPSQVVADRGLYGEYIATMAAREMLENNRVKGYVFNNVIIPKKDGDFNEIDVVAVSEMGIHVIEAKARVGKFSGQIASHFWYQQLGDAVNEMVNPIRQNLNHVNYLVNYLWENVTIDRLKPLTYTILV